MPASPALKPRLEALLAQTDLPARIAADPIRFPRRYRSVDDVEVAAVFAALFAFGRVELFGAVLEELFRRMDSAGGPAAWVDRYDGGVDGLYYRWVRDTDIDALAHTLRRAREGGRLGRLFPPGDAAATLEAGLGALRAFGPSAPSRAFAAWFPSPSAGSACKRWCMLLRWLVRHDAVDLGVWTHLSPRQLVVPLDTHVFRVARFLGFTTRATPGWRAAVDVTTALRRFDPGDPVRYDFALAHLGISGGCLGHRDALVCSGCPLDAVCRAPSGSSPATPAAAARPPGAAGRARRGTASRGG